jgi:competence protein ComEC
MKLRLTQKQLVWFYGVGFGVLALAIFQAAQMSQGGSIHFLNVGQGDSILIQTPEFHQILIDAGPGSAVVDELGKTMGFFDKSIDLFVLSHPDRDHFAGALDVMQKYKIDRFLLTGVASEDTLYQEFLSQAKAARIPIDFAEADQDYRIGSNLYLDVLYPLKGQSLVGQTPSDKNDTSAMIRLVRKESDETSSIALLTGDAEAPEESEVMVAGEDLKTEILKLGHHGSKFSTSDEFLKEVSPKTVVVSAGEGNKYGHPSPETMEKVKNMIIRRTDREGTITLKF